MMPTFKVISPNNNRSYAERTYATNAEIELALKKSLSAQHEWRNTPVEVRKKFCLKAVSALLARQSSIAEELSWQMGRPLRYTPDEIKGFAERARHMARIAADKLTDIEIERSTESTKLIRRTPHGIVFSIVPWNYPYLTAVNVIIPALMAGNSVIMKPSSQTPLTAERLFEAFDTAGLPSGLFQYLFLDHPSTVKLIQNDAINYVSFTGSTQGGRDIEAAAVGRFIDIGLELGGKDPAYVRHDAELEHTVENLIDGAFFNSGQSCCGIERIYVHKELYQKFCDNFIELTREYRLGDPLHPDTTLGPMVNATAATRVRDQISDAIKQGATPTIDEKRFTASKAGTAYLAPQVLLNVDHSMSVMRDESFGPVVGIMSVDSDEQAIKLMNDSPYGLTASIWTTDQESALNIGNQLETGTCFMNRCDYLNPALAWSGVKNSGKGCSLSELAYERLTQPKSFYFRN
ncbi:Aldehyde dehydrogenase [hydrothermal vent metagenome]|uniref:Aldehyde dehydrogenase n=1 Tax=hydrothermal vent metagenome TaxID=652676 RepID=A0A3B0ZH60_9ZZZZ